MDADACDSLQTPVSPCHLFQSFVVKRKIAVSDVHDDKLAYMHAYFCTCLNGWLRVILIFVSLLLIVSTEFEFSTHVCQLPCQSNETLHF
jgi:hypothetical protein